MRVFENHQRAVRERQIHQRDPRCVEARRSAPHVHPVRMRRLAAARAGDARPVVIERLRHLTEDCVERRAQRGLARQRAALVLANVVYYFVYRQAGLRWEGVRGAAAVRVDGVEPV